MHILISIITGYGPTPFLGIFFGIATKHLTLRVPSHLEVPHILGRLSIAE
jgi:hypothetical protein